MMVRYACGMRINLFSATLLLYLMLSYGVSYAQLEVYGTVLDSTDATPLVGAYAMLLRQPSSSVVSYALTDGEGKYVLKVDSSGAYQIKVSYLGYRPSSRDLVYDGASARVVKIDFTAAPLINSTQTIVVSAGRPPIIVQGDTTTFAVDHWADVDDEDLEAVLKKMPGFSVAQDGELSYRGKKIEKITIDGKEVANVGAALLTRGISAQNVETIQIRERDQDSKLKESLLDDDGITVLDIKLKDDYKYATFGRVRLGAGSSPYFSPLGYGSVFSLRKKIRIHLLTEYDAYGDPKISIEEIKNLGREAYTAIFNTPADFSRLQQRAEYDRQIYGFNQFTDVKDATLAFSLNTDLGKDVRLFAGSYQNLDVSTIGQFDSQRFFEEDQQFSEFTSSTVEQQRRFDSKNKIELDYSRDSIKIRYNINGVFATDRPEQQANYSDAATLSYAADQNSYSIYQNLNMSGLFRGGGGFAINAYQSFNYDRYLKNFTSEGFAQLPLPGNSDQVVSLNQRDTEEEAIFIIDNSVRSPIILGIPITLGYRYLNKQIDGERVLNDEDPDAANLAAFSGRGNTLKLSSHLLYASISAPLSLFILNARLGYNFYQYPDAVLLTQNKRSELIEYKFSANLDLEALFVQISFERQASPFPLAALRPGATFSRFNLLTVPTRSALELLPERVANVIFNTYALENYGIVIEGAVVYGETNTSPDISANIGSPTITQEFAQNPSNYWVGSMKEAKVFDKSPLVIRFEQAVVRHQQTNFREELGDQSYKTAFTAVFLKSELRYQPEKHNLNFRLSHDFNIYRFSNDLSTDISNQRQHNLNVNTTYQIPNWKMRLGLEYKVVLLSDATATTNFNLFGLSARYMLGKGILRLQAENIFDIRQFDRRTIDPVLFSIQQRSIFGRAFYFTYQFDI